MNAHRPLRIGLVVQNAVRQDGQGRAMLELTRTLTKRGHDAVLYAHDVDPSIEEVVEVQWIPKRKGPQVVDDLAMLRAASAAMRGREFDVACTLGPTALPPCPTVYYAQFSHRGWRQSWSATTRPGLYHRTHARALQALEDRCVRHAARAIAVSPATAREIVGGGQRYTPVDVVPNGIDIDEFTPVTPGEREEARRAMGLAEDVFVVGFLGDYTTPRKGVDSLVAAVALGNPSDRLVVAGRGDEQRVRAPHVVVAGFVPARRVISAADVVAVPSRYEPFSLVAVEAAASAVPVLVSDRVGAAPLLGDGARVVTGSHGPHALAGGIAAIKAMGDEGRRRMGLAGRAAAEELSWDVTSARAADIVESVATEVRASVGG